MSELREVLELLREVRDQVAADRGEIARLNTTVGHLSDTVGSLVAQAAVPLLVPAHAGSRPEDAEAAGRALPLGRGELVVIVLSMASSWIRIDLRIKTNPLRRRRCARARNRGS